MSDPDEPGNESVVNQEALEELAWELEASAGQFKFILARCNDTSWRSHLVPQLQPLCALKIRILVLPTSEKTLYATIKAEVGESPPEALMILGLEAVSNLENLLTSTNLVRDEFRKNFHFPLVFWVTDEVLKKLLRLAPDFESWATTTTFAIAP